MSSPDITSPSNQRWFMLLLISLGYVSLTLNWFNVAAAFPLIGTSFGATLPQLSLLVSLFLAGFGIAHIPGGLLATRIGLKRTVVIGILIEGIGGVLSGISPNYATLAIFRVVTGIGGSIFLAVGVAAITVWFTERGLALALGIGTGVGFCVGVAMGLYLWGFLQAAVGWHLALVIGGLIGILIAALTAVAFQTPHHTKTLQGTPISRAVIREALADRDIWIYGIAMIGAYGAYFTASQFLAEYAVSERHYTASAGNLLAALIGLAGIPGSVAGGWFADHYQKTKAAVVLPMFVMAALLLLIPFTPAGMLWPLGIGIGFVLLFAFTAWSSVPDRVAGISHANIGTSIGLMLTLSALGGFLVPLGFGRIVPATGFAGGWIFLAAVSAVFALAGLAGRDHAATPKEAEKIARTIA
ncbi:MFS transporter [Nocardia sp. CA2R105]|uniref:MFS transporter n=1 Tax=Nocardia coffeae TaxID=2873381 RepID=UPI001CA6B000|nr:MFS transporter [Nocardia coffeae]MBY8863381.1 MFS transporter [Nocardia coffeae]